jgi:cytochrome c peroxidase
MRAPSTFALVVLVLYGCSESAGTPVSAKARLGETMFKDPGLSEPAGQACADCHRPESAFRDPEVDRSTSGGVVPGRFGSRSSPTAMYAAYVPALHFEDSRAVGGLDWDGRADSLEEQAGMPLLAPLEMNNPDKASVVDKVRRSAYAGKFREVFGSTALDHVDEAFTHVTEAIAAYERTAVFAPFSSKYDRYLSGTAQLTDKEQRGLALFEDPARGNCAGCHPSRPSADGAPPMFTNHTYANLGVPRYANSMFFAQPLNPDGERYIDHGLMQTVGDPAQDGKFRVPTLRNIARTAPYGHNGYFASLQYFIDFLNTRDVGSTAVGTCSRSDASARCAWPEPEVGATVDHSVGRLGLSPAEVNDVVAFLTTLTDETE